VAGSARRFFCELLFCWAFLTGSIEGLLQYFAGPVIYFICVRNKNNEVDAGKAAAVQRA
jgi:hypothetical protein